MLKYFYYFTEKQRQVAYPASLKNTWKDRVPHVAVNVFVIPSTRARPAISWTSLQHDNSNISQGDESPNNRRRIEENRPLQSLLSYLPDSPEARQVFRPRTLRTRMRRAVSGDEDGNTIRLHGESAEAVVKRRIKLLQSVHEKEDNWRSIVMGWDEENFCSKAKIFEIRQHALFLCCAYQLVLTKMNDWMWHNCSDHSKISCRASWWGGGVQLGACKDILLLCPSLTKERSWKL